MLGAGLQFGRSRRGDRFYDPAKARRNYQNQQSQDHLWRAQSDDVTVQSQSPSKEDKSVVSKESPKPVVTPALEPVVSPLCNLERFLESIIPSVPAQYLSKVASKKDLVDSLVREGFSKDVAQWVVTNLRQSSTSGSSPSSFSWVFDLNGIAEMYESYEETNLWKIVEDVPRGVHVNFLKAERSLHRWALEDLQRIHTAEELAADEGGGVEMHVLEDAGHWVHADNPDGLFKILSFSFQGF